MDFIGEHLWAKGLNRLLVQPSRRAVSFADAVQVTGILMMLDDQDKGNGELHPPLTDQKEQKKGSNDTCGENRKPTNNCGFRTNFGIL